MEVSPPPFGRQGLRTLAAIVFIDVVSFSAHINLPEMEAELQPLGGKRAGKT